MSNAGTPRIVRGGSFCSELGATAETSTGRAAACSVGKPGDRPRWRATEPPKKQTKSKNRAAGPVITGTPIIMLVDEAFTAGPADPTVKAALDNLVQQEAADPHIARDTQQAQGWTEGQLLASSRGPVLYQGHDTLDGSGLGGNAHWVRTADGEDLMLSADNLIKHNPDGGPYAAATWESLHNITRDPATSASDKAALEALIQRRAADAYATAHTRGIPNLDDDELDYARNYAAGDQQYLRVLSRAADWRHRQRVEAAERQRYQDTRAAGLATTDFTTLLADPELEWDRSRRRLLEVQQYLRALTPAVLAEEAETARTAWDRARYAEETARRRSGAAAATAMGDIRQAVLDIAGHNRFVELDELREHLGDRYAPADVDRALFELSIASDVSVFPESNQKVLTARQRAAAVRIGNQDKHIIAIYEEA